MKEYTVSLDCASQLNMEPDVEEVLKGGMYRFHYDIMDGHNVPNYAMNFDLLWELKTRHPQAVVDVHLMVDNPDELIERCASSKADYVVFDMKESQNALALLKKTAALGMKAGLAINPEYQLEDVKHLLPHCDLLTFMSVKPGRRGQTFGTFVYDKLRAFDAYRKEAGLSFLMSVDGGINPDNGKKCFEAGADMLVLGVFAVFKQGMPVSEACKKFMKTMED